MSSPLTESLEKCPSNSEFTAYISLCNASLLKSGFASKLACKSNALSKQFDFIEN